MTTHVYRLLARIPINPHLPKEVVGRMELAQEWAVDGDLVDVGRLKSVQLGVSIAK